MKFLGSILILEVLTSTGLCLQIGRSNADGGRIVGGFPARIQEIPYQASLQFFDIHICGGVIISSTFILTACHCEFFCKYCLSPLRTLFQGTIAYQAAYLTVRVGSTLNYEGGDVHNVAQIFNNPNYKIKTMDYDAALLRLVTPIAFDHSTKEAIDLPYFREPVILDTPLLVSGWGKTLNDDEDSDSLRAVILTVSDQRACNKMYIG